MFEHYLRTVMDVDHLRENGYNRVSFFPNFCLISIDKDLIARVQFDTGNVQNNYSHFIVRILNRTEGVVDTLRVNLTDVLGVCYVGTDKVRPHIWVCDGKASWYRQAPSKESIARLRDMAIQYMNAFR